jgi:hypothetical protein
MSGHGEKLSRRREAALAALLSEPTLGQAADKAGVSERTLRAWLKLPDFLADRDARRQVVEGAIARLQQATNQAVDTLCDLLGGDTPAPTRARAALGILDQAAKGVALLDHDERILALERAAKHTGGRRQQWAG